VVVAAGEADGAVVGPADAAGDVPGEALGVVALGVAVAGVAVAGEAGAGAVGSGDIPSPGRAITTRVASGVGTDPATPTDPLQAETRPTIAAITPARRTDDGRPWPWRVVE
jgi:hypothetical protein